MKANQLTSEQYLAQRVQDQIAWYDQKSSWNQRQYKRLKLTVIILSVTIPFLTGLIEKFGLPLTILVGIMGVCIAIIEGLQSLYKYHDNWLEYRKAAELLKREQLLFNARSGPYKTDFSLANLVERCENIMGLENQQWLAFQQTTDAKIPGS